jgi:tetratricopeptide (TPR) repeat protein
VAWSWDLLGADERALAERLSVFPGGITPGSAEAVRADRAAGAPMLDLLAALVDKSLLELLPGTEPRYRMLETIREFGLARLARTQDLARARAAHAAYFLDLAETAEPHLRGHEQLPWLDKMTAEHGNLVAALHTACEAGDAGTAVRLAAPLGMYWMIRGEHGEAASWLDRALRVPGAAPPPGIRAAATALWAVNAVLSGAPGRAAQAAETSRDTADAAPAEHPVASLLIPALAVAADDPGALADPRWQLTHPDPWTRAMHCLLRAFLIANHGDFDGMARLLADAAGGFRMAGERWGLATSLTFLGYAHATLGGFADAVKALDEPVRLLDELGTGSRAIMPRVWLAEALWRQGDTARARAGLLAITEPGAAPRAGRHAFHARKSLGDMARLNGDLDEAASHYQAAAENLSRIPASALWVGGFGAMLRSAMAHLAVAGGGLALAREQVGQALAAILPEGDMPLTATVAVALARLRHAEGRIRPRRASTRLCRIIPNGRARAIPVSSRPDTGAVAVAVMQPPPPSSRHLRGVR